MTPNSNSRREFLRLSSLSGLGLVLGVSSFAKNSSLVKLTAEAIQLEINPFIIIDNLGNITLVNPRPDMGQGSTQAVPSLLAEELEVSLEKVKLIQSDGKSKYGSQTAGGSSSVRELWEPLRKAGAAAREMLTETAAKRWGVPVANCYAEDARIHLKNSDKSFSYGELADEAAKLPVPKEPKLKDPKDFKIIGKVKPRLDVPARVTGKAVFGLDVDVPGMVYAAILHAPAIHGKIVSIDDAAAKKIPGVIRVMKAERPMPHRTSEAVAVIASNWWAAMKGKKALNVTWDNAGLDKMNTDAYFAKGREAAKAEGINFEEKGDIDQALTHSEKTLEAVYETPFLAHAPIEPENAIAHVKDNGDVEIWAPIQGPDWALRDVAGYLKIKPEQIKINVFLLGGAFGRKAYHDFLLEACFLSKELKKPVKVIWTREDDITQGPYRPGMLSAMKGAVNGKKIAAFHHHAIGESISRQVFNGLQDHQVDDWISGELSAENHKYEIPTWKLSWSNVKTDIPVVWWRSVYASNFAFGQECFMDELALAAGQDPIEARLALLKDERFRKVLEVIAEKSNWKENLPAGQGRGVAVFKSFGSISACCVTVSKQSGGGVKIEKVVSVIDCGWHVNPDNVKAQTEGNIVMGLTAAIKPGITYANGMAQQSNFHDYPIMRINETPKMDIHIVNSGAQPGGVGEPGLPPVAPALANAIFAATGKRLRKLPIDLNEV
ncbi:xanthine dehydrogenase family protein molybdopterin-binding subunit [Haliscomenobacter hydrossis]|uniref:Isoquinoline 1-oxidoreductase n=1 Tax=Haliscomenobacter hydrossis (strain ATCC 27775 / DSM 1100 / LMG 10767 / O) TaxID=760192 RepID=F4L4N3_HALH1|nr:molybdopterin cofactor-binding domain-containing protein [Haliscomenobacter hydrossis]AEE52981.1 Isoquinoline 1-oxidoreductase [Haliscomenobacter hydrossis DSM 1100]